MLSCYPGFAEESAGVHLGEQLEGLSSECAQDVLSPLSRYREQLATDPELGGCVHGADAIGDLLPQLHYLTIAFGQGVGGRHGWIEQEAEHILRLSPARHRIVPGGSGRDCHHSAPVQHEVTRKCRRRARSGPSHTGNLG